MVASSASAAARQWRTAFLTLRDETLTSPPPTAVLDLLRTLILSQSSDSLLAAAPHLPSHEVTSDLMLLAELVTAVSGCPGVDDAFVHVCHLIHHVSLKIRLEVNSSSFIIMLKFLGKMVDSLLGESDSKNVFLNNPLGMKSVFEIMEILRFLVKVYGKNCSPSESTQLIKLLLHIISCFPTEVLSSSHSNAPCWRDTELGTANPKSQILLEVQLFSFTVIGDTFSRMSSCVSIDLWRGTLEVLRKVMDIIASKNMLIESYAMSRFYTALLHCLHLVLCDPKGSLSEHVAGFVAALQLFFTYGLQCRSSLLPETASSKEKALGSLSLKSGLADSRKTVNAPYRPPHLRKIEGNIHAPSTQRSVGNDTLSFGFTSSDSEHSDSDGFVKDEDFFRSSKARVAAIACVQDLCRADPKSLASLWTMLLPTNDVLQPRKNQGTVMSCLLFDPVIKARIASASTLASILDCHSSVFLQVADYKESNKCGSFTTLSISLGQILMQLHRGLLFLVQHETHCGLLISLFKVLTLLVSATPYSRMPEDLLPTIVTSVRTRITETVSSKSDYINIMAAAFNCLESALSTSPPSLHRLKILEEELSAGLTLSKGCSGVLQSLFQFSQQNSHPTIRFEALQALRAVSHNYPNIINTLWEHVSATVLGSLQMLIYNDPGDEVVMSSAGKGENRNNLGSYNERCTVAAIKVLDECLRASSGFKGTDDLLECRLVDVQFPDSARKKRISSAPSYDPDGSEVSDGNSLDYSNGIRHWCEVIEKHLPLALTHRSPMIRAASVTCFAGMTSSVFFSLTDDRKNWIVTLAVTAALKDEVPSVRSAACRALGVIACFPEIFCSVRILDEFIHAAEWNTHDPLVSVRITSSWALANICDSLRHRATDLNFEKSADQVVDLKSISLLVESALRLTKDGDKIKSNAVRALGNLSRFVRFTDYSTACNGRSTGDLHWLERMVQAFVSCVTTGNVKVQWNVCHALGNLFLNETLKLSDMPWASSVYTILLLLLRDSTNFKIRIHAAVALAVPSSRVDYGDSFPDVVQGLELVLESLGSDPAPSPSSFRYTGTLEKQLTLTMLHVLGFASSEEDQILKGFFIKKASFLEEWLKSLCSFFSTIPDKPIHEDKLDENQSDGSASYAVKKSLLHKAISSLIMIYKCSNSSSVTSRFMKLLDCLS